MKTPRYDLASGKRSRVWSSRLWILAALLGALTVHAMVLIVHGNRQARVAVYGIAQATAEQHAERLNERVQVEALQTFAPVNGLANSVAAGTPATTVAAQQATLDALTRQQRSRERCRCQHVLPAAEFFGVRLSDGMLSRRVTDGATSAHTAIADSVLIALARSSATRTLQQASNIHLSLGAPFGNYALLTLVEPDTNGTAVAVYGVVAAAHPFMQGLFSDSPVQGMLTHAVHQNAGEVSKPIDTLSLQVDRADSTPLFGKLADDRKYRATVFMHGPMDGMGVTVGLATSQTNVTRLNASSQQLWHLCLLLVSTILVIAIGVNTSRRELFLARARSDFIAGTSHDLRMPLAQILLAGETLTLHPEVSDAQRASLTNSILRETRRLIGLVENVLLYSRSGAVDIKPVLQSVAVHELFADVVEAVQLAADDVGQTIEVTADASLTIWADRQLVRQALVNLVDNALKYGKPSQHIQLSAIQPSPTLVHLIVDDEGPGIPKAQRAQVFEPYERLTRDQVSERAGFGLGLAVVYHVARICRGRVWIDEAPSGGTRAVLELNAALNTERNSANA